MTVTIKRSARKTLQLSISSSGQLIIRAPLKLSTRQINSFITAKQSWIKRALAKQSIRTALPSGISDYKKQKTLARQLILSKLEEINAVYAFHWNRISIRNSSSRWGSCSRKKNLNFNYKIIYLPEEIQDYIIVHELCHLQEMNHSQRFWQLVARKIPNYLELRRKLHSYQLS